MAEWDLPKELRARWGEKAYVLCPFSAFPGCGQVGGRRLRGGVGLELPEDLSAEQKTRIPGCRWVTSPAQGQRGYCGCTVPTAHAQALRRMIWNEQAWSLSSMRGRGPWTSCGRRAGCGAQAAAAPSGGGLGATRGVWLAVTAAEGLSRLPTVLPPRVPRDRGSRSTAPELAFEAKCRRTHRSRIPRGLRLMAAGIKDGVAAPGQRITRVDKTRPGGTSELGRRSQP